MKAYRFIGTIEDLKNNGFEISDENHRYENGSYPVIGRATRHSLIIYTGVPENRKKSYMADDCIFKVKSNYNSHGREHYLAKGIIYCNYENRELSVHYPIQDLIDKQLIVEINI